MCKLEGRRRREEEDEEEEEPGGSTQPKARTPHKDVGKNRKQKERLGPLFEDEVDKII